MFSRVKVKFGPLIVKPAAQIVHYSLIMQPCYFSSFINFNFRVFVLRFIYWQNLSMRNVLN